MPCLKLGERYNEGLILVTRNIGKADLNILGICWVVGSGRVWVGGAVVRTGWADMVQARGGLGREEGVGGW